MLPDRHALVSPSFWTVIFVFGSWPLLLLLLLLLILSSLACLVAAPALAKNVAGSARSDARRCAIILSKSSSDLTGAAWALRPLLGI
jgi:hypothetical protein